MPRTGSPGDGSERSDREASQQRGSAGRAAEDAFHDEGRKGGLPGETALDAGANDVVTNEDGSVEVLCGPNDFSKVKQALEAAGFKAELAEVTMKPQTEVEFTGEDAVKMQKLLDALENLDDVQEVYTNASIADE